jgi:hypothetical protein
VVERKARRAKSLISIQFCLATLDTPQQLVLHDPQESALHVQDIAGPVNAIACILPALECLPMHMDTEQANGIDPSNKHCKSNGNV